MRLLWVAAHPDDECFTGGILAKQSLRLHQPLHLLVLTEGEGGSFPKPLQDGRPLNQVRRGEMEAVARAYGAGIEIETFYNASLPVESFPYRHEIARRWAEHADPARRIAETIRRFRPDVLLTFAPEHGGTGHPEHQLASRFATAAVRLAAGDEPALPGEPHRVAHTFYMLFRYRWLARLGMKLDPREPTETFDVRQPCADGRSCGRVMAELTRFHRTQDADMRQVRLVMKLARKAYLCAADPFAEIHDPYEEHRVRGMG